MATDQQAVIFASQNSKVSPKQTENVLKMILEEDCTIPFISRYRKERTGGLDEVQIRTIFESYESFIEREKRRAYILEAIKKQDKLTPELEAKIKKAQTLNQLEDIYAPFKSKKKTKGMKAREAGLEPLANIILTSSLNIDEIKAKHENEFVKPDGPIKTFENALSGACDIIIETFSHDTEIKDHLRKEYWKKAKISSEKRNKAEEVKDYLKFKDYFEHNEPVKDLKSAKAGHRFLAMKRGENQKVLKFNVVFDETESIQVISSKYIKSSLGCHELLMDCAKKSYNNYIHSSLDLEIKSELKKLADESAINVFGVNLKNLLLQPYLGAKTVLGVDPGVRTGCKIAVVDNTGKFIVDTVVYPHPPKNDKEKSSQILEGVIEQFKVENIAIGNGTYSRETLEFMEKYVPSVTNGKIKATIISEAGASIYSASDIARQEFPDKDPTVRGAISIARRFQDPLAELVKIDPKSIGVGQYQHDVNQARLKKSLEGVVESCVNYVGVDLNTASAPLLSYISGIGPTVAKNIVKFREDKGGFRYRRELLDVPKFNQKVFEQAAGFLRIYNGPHPLDGTFIHPERYDVLRAWAKKNKVTLQEIIAEEKLSDQLKNDKELEGNVGSYTLEDIVKSLKAPSQDPRTVFKSIEFRKDIKQLEDLKQGEWYPGVITNITQFGAFVDIGIKENGLVHVSEISNNFVEDALQVLKVGEEVKVKVIEVDLERRRISMTCKSDTPAAPPQKRAHRPRPNKQNFKNKKGGKNSFGKQRPNKRVDHNKPLTSNPFAALKNLKIDK